MFDWMRSLFRRPTTPPDETIDRQEHDQAAAFEAWESAKAEVDQVNRRAALLQEHQSYRRR